MTQPLWDNYTCWDATTFFHASLRKASPPTSLELSWPCFLRSDRQKLFQSGCSSSLQRLFCTVDIFIIQKLEPTYNFTAVWITAECLYLAVQVTLEWLVWWSSKASRLLHRALYFEQCCALCINLNRAWLHGGGVGVLRGHRNQILLHLYTIKETQEWGKNPRDCSGWNLLEIVDDNAASCVYIIKEQHYWTEVIWMAHYI